MQVRKNRIDTILFDTMRRRHNGREQILQLYHRSIHVFYRREVQAPDPLACALITCCEEEDASAMDGVRIPMERTAALNMAGEVLVPGVLETGAIEKTDGCAQAAALAERI